MMKLKQNGWAYPNNFTLAMRCTKTKYAEAFINKGEIKFGMPKSWVEYAEEHGDGLGDKYEGTMAFFSIMDFTNGIDLMKKYGTNSDMEYVNVKGRICIKKKRDMNLPCFCFYMLKHGMFMCPKEEGCHQVAATVPSSYFKDFADNLSIKEIEKLNEGERPAVIFIKDFNGFKDRLIKKLVEMGLKERDIMIESINYFDFNEFGLDGWLDFGKNSPKELFVKDIRFKEQSEGRIIINTYNGALKKIFDNPIEIGNLSDIAFYEEWYPYEGMDVEATIEVKKIDH